MLKIGKTTLYDWLKRRLKTGQIVILDNARFHKGGQIIELIEDAGCEVVYLPAYSPDFNPIEHYWAQVKKSLTQAT